MKKFKQGDILIVKWTDTFNKAGTWFNDKELHKEIKDAPNIFTIGYLAVITKTHIGLAHSMHTHPDFDKWGAVKFIPRGCILSIKRK